MSLFMVYRTIWKVHEKDSVILLIRSYTFVVLFCYYNYLRNNLLSEFKKNKKAKKTTT